MLSSSLHGRFSTFFSRSLMRSRPSSGTATTSRLRLTCVKTGELKQTRGTHSDTCVCERGVAAPHLRECAPVAGLRRGDVIMRVDGRSVRAQSELMVEIANREVGEIVRLEVRRGSIVRMVEVRLEALRHRSRH